MPTQSRSFAAEVQIHCTGKMNYLNLCGLYLLSSGIMVSKLPVIGVTNMATSNLRMTKVCRAHPMPGDDPMVVTRIIERQPQDRGTAQAKLLQAACRSTKGPIWKHVDAFLSGVVASQWLLQSLLLYRADHASFPQQSIHSRPQKYALG